MSKPLGYLAAIVLFLVGSVMALFGFQRPVTVYINGQSSLLQTNAFTAGGVLRSAGIIPGKLDLLIPPSDTFIKWNAAVKFERAVPVTIWSDGLVIPPFSNPDRVPANLLAAAGIHLFPGDRILWNGQEVPLSIHLPPASSFFLQVLRAVRLDLEDGSEKHVFYSASPSLGGALWENGVRLLKADNLSLPYITGLQNPLQGTLKRAVPISIQSGEMTVEALSAAESVGEALAEAGIPLQGMDVSQPMEDSPIPTDGVILVVRFREEIVLQQSTIPFETETVSDPETPLDQTRIIQPGQSGLKVSRVRIRFEDGKEVGRQTEAEWTANQPVNQKVGSGTKATVQILDTPDGPIEYWRAVNVYATSYSPCRSGTTKCYNSTASGAPVQRGVIGVTTTWFSLMAGQQVYIPGYGRAVISDTGGGIPGKRWIDLGFSDDDYESWHQDVTMYFLTPIPANVPLVLP